MTLELLLIEDNEGDVEMTRRALRTAATECRVSVAGNGAQGLECLRREGRFAEAPRPDLILLDINMPRMDGKMFLSEIKADPAFKAIPVVMFTSSESPTDIRDCYERQASSYVVKPFEGALYAETVREVVRFWGQIAKLP
ncbi:MULTISPECIES: response regulator [Asticcacaulis]|jgi:CheY-like chemotaxis protein|uniref:Response regulator receiver protein n=1 Tax=Asticcacaulis excentricus TaxID=78587 RepID=A0A3G9GB24_9CAUL|nr:MULTISPECIES: response regulator [Asticcacaulis]MCA1936062.1 response regulator [Asticcacaulis sp.]BBF81729.1 response regulator receiver protein [Asticcacaulis excentricus]